VRDKKPLVDSMTVRAAVATLIVYVAVTFLGVPPEVANAIAALGATVALVYLRRAVENNGPSPD
jgi:Flp pilus assembly protein TadB